MQLEKSDRKIIDPGHTYELTNQGDGVQTLLFIKKELAEGEPEGTLEIVQDGTTNEAVLAVLIDRLKYLEARMSSPFNLKALDHLEAALGCLQNRTKDREARGVEGTEAE